MLPNEIIVKILRINKSLFESSRIVSKEIRNLSLSYILNHEIQNTIIEREIKEDYFLVRNSCCNEYFYDYCVEDIVFYSTSKEYTYFYYESTYFFESYTKHMSHVFKKLENETVVFDENPKIDVDFVSFYKIMLKRLKFYDCTNKREIALELTLNKFDKISKYEIHFLMYLLVTADKLNIPILLEINVDNIKKLTESLKDKVREKL